MRRAVVLLLASLFALLFPPMSPAQDRNSGADAGKVSVYAAGSLRAVLTELGDAFRKQTRTEVAFTSAHPVC